MPKSKSGPIHGHFIQKEKRKNESLWRLARGRGPVWYRDSGGWCRSNLGPRYFSRPLQHASLIIMATIGRLHEASDCLRSRSSCARVPKVRYGSMASARLPRSALGHPTGPHFRANCGANSSSAKAVGAELQCLSHQSLGIGRDQAAASICWTRSSWWANPARHANGNATVTGAWQNRVLQR